MRAQDVIVGALYVVRVSGTDSPVRIKGAHSSGGWVGRNERTGRDVRIHSARRLRARCFDPEMHGWQRHDSLALCVQDVIRGGQLSQCDLRTRAVKDDAEPRGYCLEHAVQKQHEELRSRGCAS